MRFVTRNFLVSLICVSARGCIVLPWVHSSQPFQHASFILGHPVLASSHTGRILDHAQVVLLVRREAGYFPDSARGPDLKPMIDFRRPEDLPCLEYNYAEISFILFPFFFHVYGSSNYIVDDTFAYCHGYRSVRLTDWQLSRMPDSVKLEPVDEDSSRQSLIDLVIADVPPRYKAEVEKELRDRVK